MPWGRQWREATVQQNGHAGRTGHDNCGALRSGRWRILQSRIVMTGERWIFAAGFNVSPSLQFTARIDSEIEDICFLANSGARVAILSHQGSYHDMTATHLGHVAEYLSHALNMPIRYVPESVGPNALRHALALRPGDVALFGNTRFYAGEEANEAGLARAFAQLGDQVAVGGFSKAHRAHASNAGILEYLPGYAASSLIRELDRLAPWAMAVSDGQSAAVIGGAKPEKILIGLDALRHRYDFIIPAGITLNTILAASGLDVGASLVGDSRCLDVARQAIDQPARADIYLPKEAAVADPSGAIRIVPVREGIPPDCAIVDFVIEPRALSRLETAARVVVAGTPGDNRFGNRYAADAVLKACARDHRTLLLGGDTVADLAWTGRASAGGGSALEYIATGTCTVLTALEDNARRGLGEQLARKQADDLE